jgi:DNA-binding ferritin-like protein
VDGGTLRNGEVVSTFVAILDSMVGRVHGALEAFDEDCVTLNLFASVLADIERFAWMLRAQTDP